MKHLKSELNASYSVMPARYTLSVSALSLSQGKMLVFFLARLYGKHHSKVCITHSKFYRGEGAVDAFSVQLTSALSELGSVCKCVSVCASLCLRVCVYERAGIFVWTTASASKNSIFVKNEAIKINFKLCLKRLQGNSMSQLCKQHIR